MVQVTSAFYAGKHLPRLLRRVRSMVQMNSLAKNSAPHCFYPPAAGTLAFKSCYLLACYKIESGSIPCGILPDSMERNANFNTNAPQTFSWGAYCVLWGAFCFSRKSQSRCKSGKLGSRPAELLFGR